MCLLEEDVIEKIKLICIQNNKTTSKLNLNFEIDEFCTNYGEAK